MKNTKSCILGGLVIGSLLLGSIAVSAQQGGNRGNFNPEQFRDRMYERMKTELKASDEDWKVIQPLVEKVTTKQREAGTSRFGGMMMGTRGRPQDNNANAQNDRRGAGRFTPSAEVEALREALQATSPSAATIKTRLAAVREARKKNEAELKTAREELRSVLTLEQEARLVLVGILD